MPSTFVRKIQDHFGQIEDYRADRGENHPLGELIFVALCGTICGCDSWFDIARFGREKIDWLRKHLPFAGGAASHDTFSRVFARLDSIPFARALHSWTSDLAGSLAGKSVAFDGKTNRGSADATAGKAALQTVTAWVSGLKLCLGFQAVTDERSEISAVQSLIEMLDLKGAVVTADALHCQQDTVNIIVEKEADYLLTVKGNQPKLRDEIRETLERALERDDKSVRQCRRTETNRGRIETREIAAMPVPAHAKLTLKWRNVRTIGVIYRMTETGERIAESQTFFMSSLPCRVRDLADRLRSHWSIESSQHYALDVTFREDASRIRRGSGPEISAVFRRLALTILQQDTSLNDAIIGKRRRCGWNEATLEKVLACFRGG